MYERLSRIGFLSKSYTFKFLFIAFLGIHIPLIGLIVFVVFRPNAISATAVLTLSLILTLAATATTLFVMNGLLAPLRKSRLALQQYIQKQEIPALPLDFPDEAGILMNHIQLTITQLDDLLQEKNDLASLLSHDLRTPVHNVKALCDMILEERTKEGGDEFVKMIQDCTNDQIALLDHVLGMLRQENLLQAHQGFEQVKLADLVDEACETFTVPARNKKITLKKQVDIDATVAVQPEMFKQVLRNLLSNAIKFSYEGSEVEVAVRKKAPGTIIEVRDQGMGFESRHQEVLFERFTKAGQKGTAGESSTGIGLHLSRKIVRHHNGDLLAKSEGPDKGSTFIIQLYQ